MIETRAEVFRALIAADGEYVSGEQLSVALGVSRAAVSKAVQRLRESGYEIESAPRRGYRLASRPDALIDLEVGEGLATETLGRAVHHFESVGSTQHIARDLAERGEPHGTIVVAEEQTQGRGRMGRAYSCPPGGIWCTVLLRGPLRASQAPLVGLAAGVSVARAIASETSFAPLLKWPNDVQVAGKKVCGILTELAAEEHAVHYLLVGIGINANFALADLPGELQTIATTLENEAGAPISRARLLQSVLLNLEGLYASLREGDTTSIVDGWRQEPNMLGQRVRVQRWDEQLEGIAVDLAEDGALVVQVDGGAEVRVVAGDVLGPAETGVAA